ncbi:MAG: YmaF family protein [Pseudomonadota bacterium]
MPEALHCHNFNGMTTSTHEHRHGISGISSEEIGLPNHTHKLVGYITFNHGHEHYYSITTGPRMEVAAGHIHYYQGVTGDSHSHLHFVYGYTSVCK